MTLHIRSLRDIQEFNVSHTVMLVYYCKSSQQEGATWLNIHVIYQIKANINYELEEIQGILNMNVYTLSRGQNEEKN